MSLAHSRAPRLKAKAEARPEEEEGWAAVHSLRAASRPRFISQPNATPDVDSLDSPHATITRVIKPLKYDDVTYEPEPAAHIPDKPSKALGPRHGNAKTNEPLFHKRRPSTSREPPRKVMHMHPRPWTTCSAPGRKENPHQEGSAHMHPTWLFDCGTAGRPLAPHHIEFGKPEDKIKPSLNPNHAKPYNRKSFTRANTEPRRWNKGRMKEHYEKQDEELEVLKCHDEKFAHGPNAKMWTHLNGSGIVSGGKEKLELNPDPKTCLHLKSGIYKGKFANVKHEQFILTTPHRSTEGGELEDKVLDTRSQFDNRLRDDMIKRNDGTDKMFALGNFDTFRPCNTRSCPQMGAEWMVR